MRPTRTPIGPLAAVLAAATLAAPATAQSTNFTGDPRHAESTIIQDLRSPDARDAAAGRTTRDATPPAGQILASPDARDAARTARLATTPSTPRQDLRSPDSRDAAAGRGTFNAPDVTVIKLRQATPAQPGGIDWADAAIGAGAATGLLAISLAGAMTLHRRRSHPSSAAIG